MLIDRHTQPIQALKFLFFGFPSLGLILDYLVAFQIEKPRFEHESAAVFVNVSNQH